MPPSLPVVNVVDRRRRMLAGGREFGRRGEFHRRLGEGCSFAGRGQEKPCPLEDAAGALSFPSPCREALAHDPWGAVAQRSPGSRALPG